MQFARSIASFLCHWFTVFMKQDSNGRKWKFSRTPLIWIKWNGEPSGFIYSFFYITVHRSCDIEVFIYNMMYADRTFIMANKA
jgi:hypothetical protein